MGYLYDQKHNVLWVDITSQTAHLFWSDVKKVEISEYFDDNQAVEKVKKKIADRVVKTIKEDLKNGNGIEANHEHIRLTFIGGHQIEFWNSEWGGVNVFRADRGEQRKMY